MSIRKKLTSKDYKLGKLLSLEPSEMPSLKIPDAWKSTMDDIKGTINIKNFIILIRNEDGSIKIVPTNEENPILLRIKTKNIQQLMIEIASVLTRNNIKAISTAGICPRDDYCYWDVIIRNDEKAIKQLEERISSLTTKELKKELVMDFMVMPIS